MVDELLRRAAHTITDLRKLASTLNHAGYPGDAIRVQGFAGLLRELEAELVDALTKVDAGVLCKDEAGDQIAATCIVASSASLISSPATRDETAELCCGNRAG